MRYLLLTVLLAAGLTACTRTDEPIPGPDTTGIVIPDAVPEISTTAQALVGRWSSQNGNYLTFREDGILSVMGRDQQAWSYRVLGDSLVVADSTAILAVESIPASNRYHIASLTSTDLMLTPEGGTLGGSYVRDAVADTMATPAL